MSEKKERNTPERNRVIVRTSIIGIAANLLLSGFKAAVGALTGSIAIGSESDTVIDWSPLYNFTNFVMNASDIAFYSQYGAMFDADNAVDYFIFINALKAMDNMGRNLFVARYKKTGTFFYAPWDLDAIWGLDTEGQPTTSAEGILSNGFFARLMDDCSDNGFANKTRDRYNALRETVSPRLRTAL